MMEKASWGGGGEEFVQGINGGLIMYDTSEMRDNGGQIMTHTSEK